jgi:uncharacterized protein YecA (UPF0149 family)
MNADILKNFNLDLNNIDKNKLTQITNLTKNIKDINNIKQKDIKKIIEILSTKKSEKTIKIGRNEKCPCESGIKWKKCCGKIN